MDIIRGMIPEKYFWMFKIGVKGKGYDYIGDPPPPPPELGGPSGSAPLCKGSKGQPRKIISSPRLSSCVVYKKLTYNLCLHTKIYLCKVVGCYMLQLGRKRFQWKTLSYFFIQLLQL
jgi:hypothetical protein